MQVRKTKRTTRGVSLGSGQSNSKAVSQRLQSSGRKSVSRRKKVGSPVNAHAFILKPVVKCLNGLKVLQLQGGDNLSDPAEQLKAIGDLYPHIKKVSGFKESDKWTEKTDPSDILHDMLLQFYKNFDGEYWEFKKNTRGKYTISFREEFGNTDSWWIRLDFLPKICNRYPELHEFLCYAFMIATKCNGIESIFDWCGDGKSDGWYYREAKERLLEQSDSIDEDDLIRYQQKLEYYGPKGSPYKYSKFFRTPVSVRLFKKKLHKYNPRTDLEKICIPFLNSALALAETKMQIHHYCDPYHETLTPDRYMRFIWSWDDDDILWSTFSESIDMDADGLGVSPLCFETDISEGTSKETHISNLNKLFEYFRLATKMIEQINNITKDWPEELVNFKKKKKSERLVDILV